MAIDLSRATSGLVLEKEVSSEIWANAVESSSVMQLAQKIDLPGAGLTIPIITGDAEADWVDETDEISVDRPTFSSKSITGYKVGVIIPLSKEFRRDANAIFNAVVNRAPAAIAKKVDSTIFGTSAPGSNFDTIGAATAVALSPHATDVKKNTYAGLVEAYTSVANNSGTLNGWALSSQAKGLLLGQVDSTGRPLLLESIQGGSAIPQLLGEGVHYSQGVYKTGTPATIGFAGDWASAFWGAVEDLKIEITDQASITDGTTNVGTEAAPVLIPNVLNLWQRDMFAIKVTAEIGFRVRDVNRFVKLTNAARS